MRSGTFKVLWKVAQRPGLWPTAAVEAKRMAPSGWWRRRPFLPLPDPRLVRFRTVTQYGDPEHALVASDVVTWLEWCRVENRRG